MFAIELTDVIEEKLQKSLARLDPHCSEAYKLAFQEGYKEGYELGFREGQLDLLKKMLELGMQKDEVCKLAGLSPSELESLDL